MFTNLLVRCSWDIYNLGAHSTMNDISHVFNDYVCFMAQTLYNKLFGDQMFFVVKFNTKVLEVCWVV